jgi:hypothetical protein
MRRFGLEPRRPPRAIRRRRRGLPRVTPTIDAASGSTSAWLATMTSRLRRATRLRNHLRSTAQVPTAARSKGQKPARSSTSLSSRRPTRKSCRWSWRQRPSRSRALATLHSGRQWPGSSSTRAAGSWASRTRHWAPAGMQSQRWRQRRWPSSDPAEAPGRHPCQLLTTPLTTNGSDYPKPRRQFLLKRFRVRSRGRSG